MPIKCMFLSYTESINYIYLSITCLYQSHVSINYINLSITSIYQLHVYIKFDYM